MENENADYSGGFSRMEEGKQRVNILLVDDNSSNLLALETILQAPDRNLVRASSGEDALRFLLDEDAAVILLDVNMPGISGLETAALIREREQTRNVPIIFLTAYGDLGDLSISQGYSLGAVDYIVKPIDPEALKSKVAVFVELYRKTEQIKRQADLLREQNVELKNANLQRLSRLIDLGQQLAAERDPKLVLKKFCDAARAMVGARYATIGILEDDGGVRHFFTSGFDCMEAVESGVPQACQRLLKQRFKDVRSLRLSGVNGLALWPKRTQVKSFVGAPILQQGRSEEVRGWLYLAEKIGAPGFNEADERFTVTLTQAVVFYENAKLYADLQRHAAALEQEVAERKQAEERLRESEERYRAVVDSQAEMLCRFRPDGTILFVNPAYAAARGATPEALIGGNFWDFVAEEDRPGALDILNRLTPEAPEARIENRFETTGGARWILWTNRALAFDANGRLTEAQSSGIDITDRKRMEEALKEADRRKDEFLAMLGHELRNPLAPILNAAHALKLVGPADADQQWAREVIERQTRRLARLVDDLLDVSRITQGKVTLAREPLDLSTIINHAVETSRPLIDERRHKLTVAFPPQPTRVEGDLTRLVQVVGNLLNNAAKYTDEGGHIWLEAAEEGDEAVIRVRDNGMGISADLLPHVFALFTQADRSLDRSHGGLGIGLTLVRHLVEMHGGRVEARSGGPGCGSEFIVRLPAMAPSPAAYAKEAVGERARPASGSLKILVVEDNVDSAESMALLLRLNGHEVRIAHDGPSALEAARSFEPQVVLCDIGLPGMDGYEVAARLRKRQDFKETPLIALTGYGQEGSRRRAKEAGFDYHLVKPVEPGALDKVLDSLRANGRAL